MPEGMPYNPGMDTTLLMALFSESKKCVAAERLVRSFRAVVSRPTGNGPQRLIDMLEALRLAMLSFADLFPLNIRSIHGYLNHLDMVVPSISATLDRLLTIMKYCLSRRYFDNAGWDHLLFVMSGGDRPGVELWDRLKLYHDFFNVLFFAIIRAPSFEWKRAEDIRVQIMDLRDDDGIRPPKNLQTVFVPFNHLPAARVRADSATQHWAIKIMDRRPKTMTKFETQCFSEIIGEGFHWNETAIAEKSNLIFQRTFRNDNDSFKNDGICLTVFINHTDKLPYLLLRTMDKHSRTPSYQCRQLNDIRIERDKTTLHLWRWSFRENCFVYLAVLHFDTFEELVVTQCALLALKAQTSLLARAITHEESRFRDDTKILNQPMVITDGGVLHKLHIYRDNMTATKRLYACVAKGERLQAHAPAWTVFFSDRKTKPRLECIGDNTLIIHHAAVYTFGDRYTTPRHDIRHFEIHFVRGRGKFEQQNAPHLSVFSADKDER
ncbi:hypothetical protein ISF_03747 [Cordyceps fumosorosea ARSEF 2679]|uniref:Uncharacterized protein n=1 Tax=Cordyceps fumosorosea (strain ARSEF 2679) TaxID=1081104 RepID=A0A167ZIW6_CORFA|nr:hypothetical protein ISF_03747 [Cordyceps fumosorosea ARSEF 2679]OAA67571.1 hypothetical protein ISF_03747 [Cordyceps fumosorosea ARSEF 2679]